MLKSNVPNNWELTKKQFKKNSIYKNKSIGTCITIKRSLGCNNEV